MVACGIVKLATIAPAVKPIELHAGIQQLRAAKKILFGSSSDHHRRHPAAPVVAFKRATRSIGVKRSRELLEPISKSPEEDNEASELYEAEEVLGVVFPTDEDAALPLNPSKEALHEPASHIAA